MSSNLMPGYNDDYFDQYCQICEKHEEDCECPVCPKCGFVGNPDCYRFHGLTQPDEEENDGENQT